MLCYVNAQRVEGSFEWVRVWQRLTHTNDPSTCWRWRRLGQHVVSELDIQSDIKCNLFDQVAKKAALGCRASY